MAWWNVGVAAVGVVSSVVSSSNATSASKKSASAQTAAADAQTQLAREQLDRANELNQPYIKQGNKADAYRDALMYGSGSYAGGAPSGDATQQAAPIAPTPQAIEQILRDQYPDLAFLWDTQPGKYRTGNPAFANLVAGARGQGAVDSATEQAQTAASSDPANGPQQTVTRADVEGQIAASTPYQLGDQEYTAQEGIAGQAYADQNAIRASGLDRNLTTYGAQRDSINGIEDEGYARDTASYGEERTASGARNGDELYTGINLAGLTRADREGVAARNRTGLRGVGDENFNNTRGILDTSYATRQGLTSNAVNAWDAIAQDGRNRAIDAAASRLGVTGQTGRTARTIGDVEQSYARDRALYEADRRLSDFDTYDQGVLGADATRGGTYAGAETAYGNDLRGAVDAYGNAISGAYDTYFGNERSDAQRYYDQSNTRSGVNTANRSNTSQQYYDQTGAAYADDTAEQQRIREAYANARSQNQANQTASRQGAYADYVGSLNNNSNRGYSASNAAAGYGQNYASSASDAVGRSADAASAAATARGNVQQTLYGDVARIAGDAYGSISMRRNPSPAAGSTRVDKNSYVR